MGKATRSAARRKAARRARRSYNVEVLFGLVSIDGYSAEILVRAAGRVR